MSGEFGGDIFINGVQLDWTTINCDRNTIRTYLILKSGDENNFSDTIMFRSLYLHTYERSINYINAYRRKNPGACSAWLPSMKKMDWCQNHTSQNIDSQFELKVVTKDGNLLVENRGVYYCNHVVLRNIKEEINQKVSKLLAPYGVEETANLYTLMVNPFLYDKKIVGVPAIFKGMQSRNQAYFLQGETGQLVLEDVPTTRFTSKDLFFVIFEVNADRSNGPIFGRYIEALECADWSCSEYMFQ
ncbi:hypothetical protein VQ045_18175 [Aurantimonas sp. E1-2-R+4]|uniref:hypothetical protein n=1 Tax=Aurantimonas sp. E1-2-R+4 TaxID=3113714 RepID=UPI002F9283C0